MVGGQGDGGFFVNVDFGWFYCQYGLVGQFGGGQGGGFGRCWGGYFDVFFILDGGQFVVVVGSNQVGDDGFMCQWCGCLGGGGIGGDEGNGGEKGGKFVYDGFFQFVQECFVWVIWIL